MGWRVGSEGCAWGADSSGGEGGFSSMLGVLVAAAAAAFDDALGSAGAGAPLGVVVVVGSDMVVRTAFFGGMLAHGDGVVWCSVEEFLYCSSRGMK